jgi:hypothetical protein
MNLPTLVTVLTLVTTLSGAGWYARETLATKGDVVVAASKAETALDLQMEALISKIAQLDSKVGKTQEELEQLRYWRQQLERLRKMRGLQS